jgi:hypothetical protein
VRYCEYLTANAKLLFWEISALSDKTGFCYASNWYFWKIYGVSERSISFWIQNLQKNWFIEIIYNENSWKRLIKMFWGVEENFVGGRRKPRGGVEENFVHINTTINTKNSYIKKDIERSSKMSAFNIQ